MKAKLILFFALCSSMSLWAQFAFVHGDHSLELSGLGTITYSYRTNIDKTKKPLNFFEPRNAQLKFEYNYRIVKFVLQADIAAISVASVDPEVVGLMNLFLQIKPVGALKIRAGFFKVRYSRGSMVSEYDSPFFNKAEICRGQVFGSRDFGLNVNYSLLRGLIDLDLGTYTGIAETSLRGKNDLNTKFEYVARINFAWPQKDAGTDFDFYHCYLPQFNIGANVRYNNKDNTIPDTYQLVVVGGKKIVHGYDAAFFYKGLALTGEFDHLFVFPISTARLYGSGKSYFNASGYYVQASYFLNKIHSYTAVRYDRMDQNNRFAGFGDRVTASLGSFFMKKHLQVKVNYTRILRSELIDTYNPPSWKNQLRIGVYYNI